MSDVIPRPNPLEQEPPPLLRPKQTCPLWQGYGLTECGLWALEQSIHWYGTHYIEGRARPCTRSVGRCQPCEEGWEPRRTGYLCCLWSNTGGRYILRVTEYAYRNCPVLALAQGRMRGTPLIVARRSSARCAPWAVRIAVVGKVPDLPPAVDTVAMLSHLWGIDLRRLAYAPPADGDVTPMLRPYSRRERGMP